MSSIIVPQRRVWTRQPKGGRYTLTPLGFTSFVATGLTHHGNLVGGAKRSATRNGLALDTRTSAGDREVIPYNPGFALSGSSPFAITLMLSDSNYWATGGMANAILGCADIDADGSWYIIVLPEDQVLFRYRRVGGQEISVVWYITDLTGNKIITIVRESNVGYGVWRAVVNGIDYGTSTSGSYGSGEISVGQQSLHIGATALQTGRGLQGYVNLVHVARGKVPSLPEIISVHTNPWQIFAKRDRYAFVSLGGGSSSVYSDSALSYYIRSLLSSDSGISYAIRNAIYRDDEVGYVLRAAVAQNNEVGYVLRQAIARDDAEGYVIRGLVQASDAEAYHIRGLVQTSDSETYRIRAAVQNDVAAAYDVLSSSSVASNNVVGYTVRGNVASDVSAAYALRASTSADSLAGYAVLSPVSRDVASSYAVSASESSVYADNSVSYAIDGIAPSCPSAESIAAAVLAALQGTTIPANIEAVRGQPLKGSGTEIDPWGPV